MMLNYLLYLFSCISGTGFYSLMERFLTVVTLMTNKSNRCFGFRNSQNPIYKRTILSK